MKNKNMTDPIKTWENLSKETSKIFDNFKYFDEPNKILFLNIIIGEAIKEAKVSPLNCLGLLSQLSADINNYVRTNLSMSLNKDERRSYVG